jgi:uncharacterized protein YtpQ (UPF0354 family)
VKTGKGIGATAYLDNAYASYKAAPANMEQIIGRYTAVYAQFAKDQEAAIDVRRVVPVVKDRRWLAGYRRALQLAPKSNKTGAVPVSESLNDDLVVLYAEDTPSHLRFLTVDMLKDAGLARTGLRARSIDNLKALLPKIAIDFQPGINAIRAGGTHESALLLVEDFWLRLKGRVDGDPVVAMPARGLLLFVGSKDLAGLIRLRKAASDLSRTSPYPVTDKLFAVRDGKVVRFR